MKFALFLVLSLSAMALAGPAFNKDNQIQQSQDASAAWKQQQRQQQCMTETKGPAIDILKQWCFSSQMSQQELTASFKKLVQTIKSGQNEQAAATEQAVMSECICQGAKSQQQKQQQQKSQADETQTGSNQQQTDAQAHELIKDVYMDALISADSRECTQQLLKIVQSQKVDSIRAAYYMTRIAVADKQSIKDGQDVKQFAETFIQQAQQQQHQHQQSEAIERQKLFATTALIGKWIQQKPAERQQIAQVAQEVAKTIVERYIKPVSQQEVEQYKQAGQQQPELAKKIAKRSAALKALANIPGHVLKQCQEAEQSLKQLAQNKQELSTVRQSAIECFEQNDKQMQLLKELAFDQDEPIEVRVAAYRALMTSAYAADDTKQQQQKQQQAQQIVEQVVKHCEQNQQQDDQFVLYAISHLDNVRTSQQPEHQAIKDTIGANKQHYMQIQVLAKKLKEQLSDVRRSSRNYKLEQEFNQLESGLVLEGDLIYESKNKQQQQQAQILPKLVRVNMSMPIMGETVNVVEITLRQNQMDEEILSALKMVQSAKFDSQSVSKVVDSFKSTVERQQQKQQQQYQQQQYQSESQQKQVEADLTIKVDGCTIVYLSVDDFKTNTNQQQQQHHQRNTRSIYSSNSIVDEVIEYLKRQPVAFNRGFNVNINERLAKVLDVDANILAGLRFESRAQGHSGDDFEIVAQMEPRFSFEAVVGPAKMTSKKLLQRVSTKTALGFRLRFKKDQLVDMQVDLPMNTMELFTVETQLVERSDKTSWSYNYLPESIYGQEDIYSAYAASQDFASQASKYAKRSIGFGSYKKQSAIEQLFKGKGMSHSFETSPSFARATGLSGKLRVAASPKDMSFLASAVVEKYEPQMEGYRVKVEKTGGRTSADQQTYMVTFATPGSRTDRTMQMRLTTQTSQQRTLVKAEIQTPRQSAAFVCELVHDGRQYSIKSELASRSGKQWRHAAELGFVQTQQAGGRLSSGFSYKPYAQIESTSMKRPVQLQGQIAYSQSPKSVISYELKCPTSGSFVQGKLIFDQRDSKPMTTMRQSRRSMQSPIEMIVSKDLTLTNEFIAQIDKHAVKVHNMLDWDCQKYALQGDSYATYKNMRKQNQEQQVSASMKVDQEEQQFSVERKSASDERKQFTARLNSKVRPTGHQMEAEVRYNGRRQSVVAYKHKVDVQEVSKNKYDAQVEVELVDSERQIAEKAQGRVRITNERKMKQCQGEVSVPSRQMYAKLSADYQSPQQHQHQAQLQVQCNKFQHKTELRTSQRQFSLQSRTEKPTTGQVYYKMQVDAQKQSPVECKIVIEAPQQRAALAADLKLASGKRSSLAIQGGRFATSVEFSFDEAANKQRDSYQRFNPFQRAANFRLRSSLKDLASKQAYWMDSQLNGATFDKDASFVRLDSPYYRTDIEYDPRSQETKVAAYGRSKRSADQFNSIYSSPIESLLSQASDKLQLGSGKLWMLRSIVSSPYGRDQLKQQARRALFEYADRRQAHKHGVNYSPEDERLSFDFSRQPSSEFSQDSTFEPIRMKADVSTRYSRPSSAMLESPFMSAEMEAKPSCFDADQQNQDDECYAKISALSRHPRSAFKKHESEIRYKRDQGYKAHMKHQDSKDKRHELRAETGSNPKSWSRVNYDSDKHGKGAFEHKWRQQQKKRAADQEDVYANEFSFKGEGPADNKWQHETRFAFEEPTRMANRRHRRSAGFFAGSDDQDNQGWTSSYPMEYLKHSSARLTSKQQFADKAYNKQNQDDNKYQLDFDYQPQANYASLNMDMPQGMQHASSVEIKPSERLYKIQSKLYNRRTSQPTYELLASTKPYVSELATANQEPVFVHSSHPMLERSIDSQSLAYKLFKQPLKLDYSDMYGRSASFDYDHMQEGPAEATSGRRIAGLRQKRAAVYYKDQDFQHSSTYDFYPEALLAKAKPSFYAATSGQMMPVAIKTNTKYGPIVVRAESDSANTMLELESPLVSAKFAGQTGAQMRRQLYTVQIDNKQQRVQLSKLVREYAPEVVRDSKMVKKIVRAFDDNKFEHQSELLASIVDQIFKVKSQTKKEGREELLIEAEYNKQTDKAYAKINGERVTGQAVIDLARYTAELKLDTDAGKHSLHHVTRLVQTSDKYYSLESMTSSEGRPVYKLSGKVSAMVFEPEHLFSRRRQSSRGNHADHQSTFEAVIYEPKEIHVSGQFDCENKEARIVFTNVEDKKIQETTVRFDDETQTVYATAQLSKQHEGQIYATKAKINLPGLFQADECMNSSYNKQQQQTCKSEIVYKDNQTQGFYAAQYYPGEQVTVATPYGKFGVALAY